VTGLGELVRLLSIRCAYRERQALYLSGTKLGPADLAKEANLRCSIGLPARFITASALYRATAIARDAALISDDAAEVNPVQLTHGLLRTAIRHGAALHAPVELLEIVPFAHCVGIVTNERVEIEVRALVFAT
jgi:glycine/D-amino acid oxidase-like deaminating enzyme